MTAVSNTSNHCMPRQSVLLYLRLSQPLGSKLSALSFKYPHRIALYTTELLLDLGKLQHHLALSFNTSLGMTMEETTQGVTSL